MLLAIAFLGPYFDYIPEASLAAIIIVAVLPTVDIRILWRIGKIRGESATLPWLCTSSWLKLT